MIELRECAWQPFAGGVRCARCGAERPAPVRRRCWLPDDPPDPPGLVGLAWNYAAAALRWTAAGSPVRSQDEIERIFAVCQACPQFVTGAGARDHCRLCGCALSAAPDGLVNKIAMATESCPDRPPRWTADG